MPVLDIGDGGGAGEQGGVQDLQEELVPGGHRSQHRGQLQVGDQVVGLIGQRDAGVEVGLR